jgi:hypothetical protein
LPPSYFLFLLLFSSCTSYILTTDRRSKTHKTFQTENTCTIREKKDVRLGPSVHKCVAIYTSFSGASVSVAGQGKSRRIRHFSDKRSCNSCACHHIFCTNCNISTCYRCACLYWVKDVIFCVCRLSCSVLWLFFSNFLSSISFTTSVCWCNFWMYFNFF